MKPLKVFSGFTSANQRMTPIPEDFFTDILCEVEDVNELKVILYAFWLVNRLDSGNRYFRKRMLQKDKRLMDSLARGDQSGEDALTEALELAVERGVFLKGVVELENQEDVFYFFNTPYGQAAVKAIARGQWKATADPEFPIRLGDELPNIFRLYEQHIGPLTPMMAEALREAELTYDWNWIEEAIRIAVEQNKRSWRYVEAILKRWKEEGKGERKAGQDTEEALRRYADQWKRKPASPKR